LLVFPRSASYCRSIDSALAPGKRDSPAKCIAALVGPIGPVEAAKREVPKAPLEQVRRRQPSNGSVVYVRKGQFRAPDHTQHIHGRYSRRDDRGGDPRVLQPRDDAVPIPVAQPARDRLLQAARLMVD